MDKRLNINSDTIKLLEEKVGEKLIDIDLGNDFLNITPKAQTTKVKINKWDYLKRNLLYSKRNN